jgi:hypothetical protein
MKPFLEEKNRNYGQTCDSRREAGMVCLEAVMGPHGLCHEVVWVLMGSFPSVFLYSLFIDFNCCGIKCWSIILSLISKGIFLESPGKR